MISLRGGFRIASYRQWINDQYDLVLNQGLKMSVLSEHFRGKEGYNVEEKASSWLTQPPSKRAELRRSHTVKEKDVAVTMYWKCVNRFKKTDFVSLCRSS